MIQVDEILNDFDLCSTFTILRTPGTFQLGGWQRGSTTTINTIGAVRNTTGQEILMVPEADRVVNSLTFRSTTKMYETNAANSETSDVLVFAGDQYRILAVKDYSQQGYYLAIAARMAGN